ncbi:hypothetical protein [Streptomyces sp. NPDC051109]|uniref:hypothetical protein n=1 Tax=Streptomyces sp. NPDC051109 TaxID=3365642 RepID=UPI001066BE82
MSRAERSAYDCAQGSYRQAARIPGHPTLTAHLAQQRQGETCLVPLNLIGSPSLTTARLAFASDGPLAFLDGHKPLLSLAIRRCRFTVGAAHI